ncbi:hypothetical protein K2X83_02915 [Patescibacteria group bacterium]|nr:hypothetical protein [Patescibacteria group bacterium]
MNTHDRSPHGGIQASIDYVIDRLSLASEVSTTELVSASETHSLFHRHLELTRYQTEYGRDSD